jgi:HK97 family phage major capsid protein
VEPLALDPAAASVVSDLRTENAKWRTRTHAAEHALSFYINKYPLGDIDNFHVSRVAYAKSMSDGRFEGPYWDKWAKWEKQYLEVAEQKAGKLGDQVSGQDGGFLAPEDWNAIWFDLLRSQSALDQLPITRLNVPARVAHIPKVLIDVTVSYPGENATTTATTYTFGQLTYSAHKAEAFLNIPNELIRDSAGLADEILRQSTAKAIATDRDTQLFVGQGVGGALSVAAPMGLINFSTTATNFTYYPNTSVSGAISTTPASFTPSYQHLAQLIAKVEVLSQFSGVNVGQATVNGAVANPQFKQTVWSSARFQTATTAQPIWVDDLNARNGLFGMKWALSNVIPTNLTKGGGTSESAIIIGDWRQYVLFECLTLAFDSTIFGGTSSTGFGADQTQVRVIHRYDGAPAHPEAFGILAGVLV